MLVAEAMEPEAPQALTSPVGGDGIGGGLGRQGGVEGGIEAGPLLQLRLLRRQPVHHPQGRAIVQGSQGHQVRYRRQNSRLQPHGGGEGVAAMHHPVPGQDDGVAPGSQNRRKPVFKHRVRGGALGHGALPLPLPEPAATPIQQGGLEAGTAGIQHQDQPGIKRCRLGQARHPRSATG
jgi:hypothetical protein